MYCTCFVFILSSFRYGIPYSYLTFSVSSDSSDLIPCRNITTIQFQFIIFHLNASTGSLWYKIKLHKRGIAVQLNQILKTEFY